MRWNPISPMQRSCPWRNSAICGAMACVAAVSKLMNLSPKETRDSLGSFTAKWQVISSAR